MKKIQREVEEKNESIQHLRVENEEKEGKYNNFETEVER